MERYLEVAPERRAREGWEYEERLLKRGTRTLCVLKKYPAERHRFQFNFGNLSKRAAAMRRTNQDNIIEQSVDEVSRNTSVKDKLITVKHEKRKATVDATSSAEWNFLLFTLILEILSAGFDQASSPSKPHYALIAMLLAAAAVFTCIWELIRKKSLVLKSWKKLHCISYPHLSDTFFENHLDTYGLVSSIYQCVFSTVQYIYFFYNGNSPISLCALPALYLMCLAGSRLRKKYHKSKRLPV